jgi:phage-related tail fiber protein
MANFKTIHTTYGLTRMAQAEASGAVINLPQIAVGDGNGNPVVPSESQTQLAREVYRAAVNRVFQDPQTPTMLTAELVIPAAVGGFVLREVGVFDDSGGLFAVGNLPETYKPTLDDGAYADTVVRIQFMVTNANVVTLQVDPNVAVATQTWIINNITPATLIPGGLTGQILTKDSNANGDFSWHDPTDVNVVVDTIEEAQTLAASQTVVDLTVTNTIGLAVYVEGVRLVRGTEWTPHATIMTRLTLSQSYPSGTKLVAVQNEPASHLEAALQQDQNLYDLQDKAVARTNLDVYSKAESDRLAPVSQVAYFARTTAPTGWLKANGAAVSRTAYAALFAAIGTTFGAGDGFNTFNLPDLRGEFLRSLDDGRGVDAGRGLGTSQTSQNLAHTHTGTTDSAGTHTHTIPTFARDGSTNGSTGDGGSSRTYTSTTDPAGAHTHPFTTASTGGTEARPRNVAMLACIKY